MATQAIVTPAAKITWIVGMKPNRVAVPALKLSQPTAMTEHNSLPHHHGRTIKNSMTTNRNALVASWLYQMMSMKNRNIGGVAATRASGSTSANAAFVTVS